MQIGSSLLHFLFLCFLFSVFCWLYFAFFRPSAVYVLCLCEYMHMCTCIYVHMSVCARVCVDVLLKRSSKQIKRVCICFGYMFLYMYLLEVVCVCFCISESLFVCGTWSQMQRQTHINTHTVTYICAYRHTNDRNSICLQLIIFSKSYTNNNSCSSPLDLPQTIAPCS